VAWRTFDGEGGYDYRTYENNEDYANEWDKRNPKHKGWVEPLYTTPPQQEAKDEPVQWKMGASGIGGTGVIVQPQRTWVELTDEEIRLQWSEFWEAECHPWAIDFARSIEAKLKEKNG
jgi:hypothetical protein